MVTTVGVLVENQKKLYTPESEIASGVESTLHQLLPDIVQLVFDNFPANNIVGVQPMAGPVGLIYSLRYRPAEADEPHTLSPDNSGNRIRLEVVSQAIEVGSRPLDAVFSVKDLESLALNHGTSAVVEAIANAVRDDITKELLTDISTLARKADSTDTDDSSVETYFYNDQNSVVGSLTKAATGDRTVSSPLMLATKIQQAAFYIARDTRRAAGNFAVIGRDVYKYLYNTRGTDVSSEYTPFTLEAVETVEHVSLTKVGVCNGTINLYLSDDIGSDEIVVGYKGKNSEVDTGFYYCPYISLILKGVGVNPITFEPYVSFNTRYGKAIFLDDYANSHNYYRMIKVQGLPRYEEVTEMK